MLMQRWTPRDLQALIDGLRAEGVRVLGPRVGDAAILYDEIETLPIGCGDEQAPGHYRLTARHDQSRFGYNLGPSTWKQFLFPPEEAIFRVQDGEFISCREQPDKMAFFGVRACELAAISIQDRVFMGDFADPGYASRRENLLLIAVNCSQASGNCFCASTGDGPAVGVGADLILTELRPEDPYYLVEAQTEAGQLMISAIGGPAAATGEIDARDEVLAATRLQMQREFATDGIAEALYSALDHPHWDVVAERCLACGNCTQVCPTCFCSSTREHVNPVGLGVTHMRRWESCFAADHSYLSGGVVRPSVKSRYRQWLTHKLAGWELQFGVSGCTGCGRCISWCPVGIDLTEEVAEIRRPL